MMAGALKFLPETGRGTARRAVEGRHRNSATCYDMVNHGVEVPKYGGRRNSDSLEALRLQPIIARLVAVRSCVMRSTIDLDRDPCFQAGEIQYERSRRVLATKFIAIRAFSELLPQKHLGQAHFTPELPRLRDRCARSRQHRAIPSTALRTAPLPATGRILQGEES